MARLEPEVFIVDEQEFHRIGEHVSVVWNIKRVTMERMIDGKRFHGESLERDTGLCGGPYISFASVLKDSQGEWYRDDDDTARGGIDAKAARQVADELLEAANYLEAQAKGDKS